MVKHHNVVPNEHFKKHWRNYVKTWFNQPARKMRRRIGKNICVPSLYLHSSWSTPVDLKILSFGFNSTPEESCEDISTSNCWTALSYCSMSDKYNTKSRAGRGFTLEELKVSADRVSVTGSNSIYFTGRDSAPEELATATQVHGQYMPIVCEKPLVELVKVTGEMKSFKACAKRMNKREVGVRLKKAAEKEETTRVHGQYMPIVCEKPLVELVKVTGEMKSFKACAKWMNKREVGVRLKKAAEKEETEVTNTC
ncbi:hypothetical protein C4D60_Mb04t11180 [Musa balbisiana]|uniref:Uncharacterized protein n=1 Tax=Musa balbisiana TaxID=52838 RepID=A0A4S8KB73_MUSBA|nr:hypothetical protein C4D60_Mb04t11180 [Musa balbisiana]